MNSLLVKDLCSMSEILLRSFFIFAIFEIGICQKLVLCPWLGKKILMQEQNPNIRELQHSLGDQKVWSFLLRVI